jgi:NTP pyrophosphatase (non-canonical NTP hydrolase)
MAKLKENPTLLDFQEYIRQIEVERGFDRTTTNIQSALLLGEEVGELFKAVRKAEAMRLDSNSAVGTMPDELADVFIYVLALANRYEVDLEKAFRDKEEINGKRVWK